MIDIDGRYYDDEEVDRVDFKAEKAKHDEKVKELKKFTIPHSEAEQELNLHNNLADLGMV